MQITRVSLCLTVVSLLTSFTGSSIATAENTSGPGLIGKSYRGLFITNIDSTKNQLVAAVEGKTSKGYPIVAGYPDWSSNGQHISFLTGDLPCAYSLRSTNSDGTGLRVVQQWDTRTCADIKDVKWSPSGDKLAYLADQSIVIISSDGSEQRTSTGEKYIEDVAYLKWSPDGTKIAFNAGDASLYTVNADGSNRIRLTNNNGCTQWESGSCGFSWSPDGASIVFANDRGLFTVKIDGSNKIQLSKNRNLGQPDWSPEGGKITFVKKDAVYSVNADGSSQVRLVRSRSASYNYPRWSPDSFKIAFVSWRDGGGKAIEVVDKDGSNKHEIAKNVIEDAFPGFSWSPDSRQLVYGSYNSTVTDPNSTNVQLASSKSIYKSLVSGSVSFTLNTVGTADIKLFKAVSTKKKRHKTKALRQIGEATVDATTGNNTVTVTRVKNAGAATRYKVSITAISADGVGGYSERDVYFGQLTRGQATRHARAIYAYDWGEGDEAGGASIYKPCRKLSTNRFTCDLTDWYGDNYAGWIQDSSCREVIVGLRPGGFFHLRTKRKCPGFKPRRFDVPN